MDQGVRNVRLQNPRVKASIWSIITFFYTYPIFKKAKKKDLDDEDVYEIIPKFSSKKLGDKLENLWRLERKKHGNQASVIRVLVSCYVREYLFLGFIQLCVKTGLILIQPLALGKVVAYFEPNQTEVTRTDLYKYAALVIGLNILSTMYNHNYMQYIVEFGVGVRTSFSALIYRKVLKLKPSAFTDITMGNIVTLITKDVGAFEGAFTFLNDIWIGMVQTVLITYIIYSRIGWSVLAGVGIFVLIIPLQVYIGQKTSVMRMKSAKRTDDRLQATKEAFSAIKIIKMYTWENYFEKIINEYRKKEVKNLAIIFYLKSLILIIGNLVSRVSIYLLIMTYLWTGHLVRAEIVYFVQSCYINLRSYITISIPLGIAQTADLHASIKRIQKFLNGDELKDTQQTRNVPEPKVFLKNVSVKFSGVEILKDVSLLANRGLHLVTGNVGSGKSALLKTIMQEYPITSGQLLVDGTISYASQEPWLFPSTIKQNILFGQPYNEKRYQEVLNVCDLTLDLKQFDDGDDTVVGDRGVNLSKGQQARINLARAVYKFSDIYLLDDCLSAVDAHVNRYVFNNCIKGFLKDKIVILVTHNVNHIKQVYGHNVLVVENGTTLSLDQQKETLDKRITYYIDDVDYDYFEGEKDELDTNEEVNENQDASDESKGLLEPEGLKKQPKDLYREEKKSGKVNLGVYLRYYRYTGGFFVVLLIVTLFVVGQVALVMTDKLLSQVNIEPQLTEYVLKNLTNTTEYETVLSKRYHYINWYTIITILGTILTFIKAYGNFYFCLKASRNLHKAIISSVINSFMTFFDSHFIGNIVNRFSKDLTVIDEYIPYIFYENFRCILGFVGIIILIASVNTIFLISAALLIVKLYFIRRYYLATGRAIKRLESSTRSPMIGYLNATLEGLTTARAYENQDLLIDEFDRHQDFYTSAYYMMQCTSRAFGFVIDMICSLFIASIVIKFMLFDEGTKAGDVGLAISQAMMLTGLLQWTIRQMSELENNMTSVERVLEYADVKTEDKTVGQTIENWPSLGKVEYSHVSLTYSTTKEKVLKDISFVVEPKQKIGIVGRTGAGKSSIISTMFRLYEIEGRVLIDDVDTSTLNLEFFRSRIAIIPQDPILFTGTIRSNIDPTERYSDAVIWQALEKVNLKQTVKNLHEGILEGASNFSSGEKQLLCLARALVSKNKIIVLDEATASMDPETCALLQETIKLNFADCTVFTIAHRLNTVSSCDKVMVVDDGRIIEFDTPDTLMGNKDGIFFSMIRQAGLEMNKEETLLQQTCKETHYYHPAWLLPYFLKGFRNQINEDDLPGPLKAHESSRLGNKLEKAWQHQVDYKKQPSLLKALLAVFYQELSIYGVFLLVQEFIVKLSQPLLVSRFLKYYEPGQTETTKNEAYIYAGLIVVFAFFNVMCVHGYYLCVMHLGMKIRVATSSLIYRKSLKLTNTALAGTPAGQIVNLLTNDVARFDVVAQYIHNLWVAPIETAVIMYLLHRHVGPTGLVGAWFLVLFILPQMYMGKKISQYRRNTAKRTDERIRLMSEIITGVQVIKMYAWEKPFANLVEMSRRREMSQISATSTIRALMITCVSVLHRSAVYLCILTYVVTGGRINATYAYTLASFYAILRQAVTMFLPRAVTQFAEAHVSVKRIERFLLLEETGSFNDDNPEKAVGVSLKQVTIKYNDGLLENTLEDVTFDATSHELVAVVGKVGGGKTALLYTILQEVKPVQGSLSVVGTVSYSSQSPWIFEGTVMQNITFGRKFLQERYNKVITACALEQDFQQLPNGDQTLIGDRGTTLSGGQKARINLARAVYRDADIYLLDDPLSAVDIRVGKHIFDQCIRGLLKDKCVIFVTNQLQYLLSVDRIYLLQNGKIQTVAKETGKTLLDEYKNNEPSYSSNTDIKTETEKDERKASKHKVVVDKEQRSSGVVSKEVYRSYLKAGGNWYACLMIMLAFIAAQFFATLSDYFVTIWVNLEQWRLQHNITINSSKHEAEDNGFKESLMKTLDSVLTERASLFTYTVLILASVFLSASRKLHDLMLGTVIKAPLNFFNTNSPGRILNRFSKDIGVLDEALPLTVADTLQIALILLSISIVIGCLNPWVLVPTVIMILIFYLLRIVFLATSRDLKRIEAVTRSPMYNHLNASINGITTIRAFAVQEILRKEFDGYQNQYSSACFLFLGANRTFGFWLDFHCVVYTALVICSILFIKTEVFGGNVGFALTEAVGLTGMFQWGIRQWSEMENQMTAVERLEEYTKIKPEGLEEDAENKNISKLWPNGGNIKFHKVCLKYSQSDPHVLKNVTLEVKSKEKVGIVGRTGAGKSSLIAALFRLTDVEGQILIDDLDIRDVPLALLRSRISVIPQEPVLFSGSLRQNLDPFEEFDDVVLWKALEDVELKKAISDLPDGLQTKVYEGGSNFSVGQKQLVCLARAIVRSNQILILDEATANVDPYTDALIQSTIRDKFGDCTVLTIAHRLHTVMDSDKILVIDSGEVEEFDRPETLLQNVDGVFYHLVKEAGWRNELGEDDMYDTLRSHEAGTLGDRLQEAWNREVERKKDPSLWSAMLGVFGFELFLYAIFFVFIEFVVKLSQPMVLSKFLTYYEPNQTEMSKDEACVYAALLIFITFLRVLLTHTYLLQTMQLSMKVRVATCSLIYRKALKLSKFALAETTIGQMVNLLSNDVSRFNAATQHVNYLWTSPLEAAVVMYLLYINVGVTALAGTFFLLVFIPFQMYMGKKTSQFRLRTAIRTDERVRLMSEIVTGIQVIKMYTWEKPFAKLVELSRRKEMQQIWANAVIRGITLSFNLVLNRAAICICILTFVLTDNALTATYAYTVSSYYATLRQSVTKAFPKAVTQLAETKVSVSRIKKFLMYEEMKTDEVNTCFDNKHVKLQNGALNGAAKVPDGYKPVGIHLKNVSVKWIKSFPDNSLDNITFDVYSNQLVAIIGPVENCPPVEGEVDVNGILSYACQEPWLFGGSVRQNIVFGQEFNAKKYEEVVRVCALERDFSLLPYGDRTLVGDRGTTLSGGQRARINLARAIYKEADIYLLDDPLSAVDTHVGKQLFDDCICGYLKNKCVVLVTHQLQYLRNVETIYLMDDGKVFASGSFSEIQTCDSEFIKLLASNNKDNEDEDVTVNRKSKLVKRITGNGVSNEAPVQEKEFRKAGDISWSVYKSYLLAGGGWGKLGVNLEQWRRTQNATISNDTSVQDPQESTWQDWIQMTLDSFLTKDTAVILYVCLVTLTAVIAISRSIGFFRYCVTASRKLHNLMFDKIVYAPMRFFNTNPPGRILNRFSKDIGAVDELLPLSLLDTLETALNVAAITLVVGSLNPWILLPTIVILVIFYYLRIVFLATSRAVKRVEATTRSPIYTHLSASLQGLTTIRAFGAQEILKKEFDNFQNRNTSPFYLFIAANRTFGFWLDFHCVIYIALVTISILFIKKETFGGNVGLALTQSISLTGMFQWGVRQWSELENNMTSVERVQEYTEVTPEKDKQKENVPRLWPEQGSLKFVKMYLRYSPDDPYVLKDLTFGIKANEKVGIVGRTGAGKSSLIAALFRLTDIEGSIIIDNIDTKDISLHTLRSNISIIPQEPVLFSGTLRKNLDPFDEYNDEVVWNALSEVELKNAVSALAAGLDSKMSEGGSNFSVGQRQLVCLARAIIRNKKILVLDEATANVDPHTDGLIQTTIRRKFANCTVLTIAHRLHTIMDSDKVLVMDAGRAVEFDHPHTLLQDTRSVFYGMVMQTGVGMAENLMSIAKENYKKTPCDYDAPGQGMNCLRAKSELGIPRAANSNSSEY
ncbi:hypothetical protein NQ315_008149 [Exocentrus adspersus]|uniref:Uncharacterized protein n=1 Tax=Exocentrus adspersus TaxID=1586481 RepID=A0AAV8VVQ3_9CUCU|nr:hypothetical protein NQ315_008149 [Exocentrus adspersus]